MLFHPGSIHSKEFTCPAGEQFFRQIRVSFQRSLLKHIHDPTANTEIRVQMDPYPMGNLIRDFKTNASHILRHPVRIFLNDPIHIQLICLVYFYRQ